MTRNKKYSWHGQKRESKMNIDLIELRREIMHALVGIAVILLILLLPSAKYLLFVVLILGSLLSFLASYYKIPVITSSLCLFERDCNKNFPGKGVIFFFIGSLISLQLFETQIALASIAILTVSDPISHFIGRNFGRISSSLDKRKKIEGTLAGILAGTLFASLFIPIWLAFTGSLSAMILELAGIKMGNEQLDDNLLIPLVSGTIIYLLSSV